MVRSFLIFAAALALAAPLVQAQAVTVCVFQVPKGDKVPDGSDAQDLATALSALKMPKGEPVKAIPIAGVSPDQENAEAQKRGCQFVADLWRIDLPPDSPLYAGTLQPGTNTNQFSRQTVNDMESKSNTQLNYSLRKTDSDKKIAHGVADNDKPSSMAKMMVKKIAKEQ